MVIALVGCRGAPSIEQVEVHTAKMIGGDSHDVTTSTKLPEAGVGILLTAVGQCTGIAITRDVVLAAGHCFCSKPNAGPNSATFHLPTVDSTGAIVDNVFGSSDWFFTTRVCDPETFHVAEDSVQDLAVVLLSTTIGPAILPEVPQIYTFGDFIDRISNKPKDQFAPFFADPVLAVAMGHSRLNATGGPFIEKLEATVPDHIFDHQRFFQYGGLCSILPIPCDRDADGWWIHDDNNFVVTANRLELQRGDSGGPLTFMSEFGTTPMIMGVFSLSFFGTSDGVPIDWTRVKEPFGAINAWSPTWDNGLNNGAFIRAHLVDADNDGVTDDIDNCPPSACKNPELCANPDQKDDDKDGIGDLCDNCSGNYCLTVLGQGVLNCANHDQKDFDGDGVGDVCDLCPELASSSAVDSDSDGIGDECDPCPKQIGGRQACQTDLQCGSGHFCIMPDKKGGKCTATSRSCGAGTLTNNFQCQPVGFCQDSGNWGECSGSDDLDLDHDGIGDACDNCRFRADKNLQINSNNEAEFREGAPPQLDACDTTAMMTLRPVIEQKDLANGKRTLFTVYAGIGSSDDRALNPPFTDAEAGFRHCDCSDLIGTTSADTLLDQCLNRSQCGDQRGKFNNPNEANWRKISTTMGADNDYNESHLSPATVDRRENPTYTSGTDCSDPLPHPPDSREATRCRLGTGHLMRWDTQADIDAGRVVSFQGTPGSGPSQTAGLLWTHEADASQDPSSGEGARDIDWAGALRDHFVFVATPEIAAPSVSRLIPPLGGVNCKTDPQCIFMFSNQWLNRLILPGSDLSRVISLLPRTITVQPDPTSGILTGTRRLTDPAVDLTPALTPGAQMVLADRTRWLMQPVESRVKDDLFRPIAISVPRSWSQLGSDVGCLSVGETNQLEPTCSLSTFGAPGDNGLSAFGGLGFVPSDREGARELYSALENSVYMVGGTSTASGVPTGEIWRLNLATQAWTHLFMQIDHPQAQVRNPQALSYDSTTGQLLVIDNLYNTSLGQTSRLLIYNTHTDTSEIAAALSLGTFSKVSLTSTGDGNFLLVGAQDNSWTSYRFNVDAEDNITWLGQASGPGLVLADPVHWEDGPSIAILTSAGVDAADLPDRIFTPTSGPPPALNICDKPPVIGPLPDITVTSCTLTALPQPTPTSACGVVAVRNDQPAILPLGSTTVTWTLTDALGNSITATQNVIAQLGDDPSCCPAGTNIIVGTPNNDTLNGTAGSDCILGLGAQDHIFGNGGNDYISGGDGDDIIDGGSGNDVIFGGSGQDNITGNIGDDIIWCGDGDDTAHGNDGNDEIHGGQGQDHLFGDNGNDKLFGDSGDDTLSGGANNDTLDGGPDHNSCSGGTGVNTLLRCQSTF
jgi:hypothetical protein